MKKWLSRLSGIKEDTLDRAWHRDRDRDGLLAEGLGGTATVVEARGFASTDDDDIELLKRDERMLFLLEIAVSDGRAPYQLQGSWKIPGFSKGWDWVQHVVPGMQVPVKVKADDPERKYLEQRQASAVVAGTEAIDDYLDKQVSKGKMSQAEGTSSGTSRDLRTRRGAPARRR